MRKKRKTFLACLFLLFCFTLMMPVTASAKVYAKKLNAYIGKSKKYTVLAYNPTYKRIRVFAKPDDHSKCYGTLIYGDTVVVDTSKLKKNRKYAWLPVYLNNRKTAGGKPVTGYVVLKNLKLYRMYTAKFSNNKTIDRAIKTGMKYLGTPFVLGGSSLTGGIDCSNFVVQCFRSAGRNVCSWAHTTNLQAVSRQIFYHRQNKYLNKKQLGMLRPGDLMFYLEHDSYGPIGHVAMYIGNGFILHSSGHYGEIYPTGGICIKRVQYGERYMVRAMRLNGF